MSILYDSQHNCVEVQVLENIWRQHKKAIIHQQIDQRVLCLYNVLPLDCLLIVRWHLFSALAQHVLPISFVRRHTDTDTAHRSTTEYNTM